MLGSSTLEGSRWQRHRLVWGWAGLSIVALCHAPTLRFGFLQWDDEQHVTRNLAVVAPGQASLTEHLVTPGLGYPIPIVQASYAAEAALLGLTPWHFHLVNVALHLVNCGLVFAIALRLGSSAWAALIGMLLFGLHPVVAEPVSWVTGRKDLLACAFGLGSLWFGLSARSQLLSLTCFGLGLLSKPSLAPLCCLLPLARFWFAEPRSSIRRSARESIAYITVLAPIAIVGFWGQRAVGAVSDSGREGAGYWRAVWYALGHHLRLVIGLEEPTAKYLPRPWPPGFVPGVDTLPLLAAGIAILSLLVSPIVWRRRIGFGLLWAVLCYLPNSNLIPLARYLADSYVYLPLVGLAWCVTAWIDLVMQRAGRVDGVLRWAAPAIVLALCAPALSRSQARFVGDEALWAHALGRFAHPRVCRLWANGVARERGDAPGLRATELCIQEYGDALFLRNKGVLLSRLGRLDEARAWLEGEQRRHPDDAGVRRALDELAALPAP